jgi:hypothetical protein
MVIAACASAAAPSSLEPSAAVATLAHPTPRATPTAPIPTQQATPSIEPTPDPALIAACGALPAMDSVMAELRNTLQTVVDLGGMSSPTFGAQIQRLFDATTDAQEALEDMPYSTGEVKRWHVATLKVLIVAADVLLAEDLDQLTKAVDGMARKIQNARRLSEEIDGLCA